LQIPKELDENEKALYHYNCAEVVLHAANKKYDLNLSEDALNVIVPFGGGMSSRRTCGIISGGVAAIGAIFGGQKPFDQTNVRKIAGEYVEWFVLTFGSDQCPYIVMMKASSDPSVKCKPIIEQCCSELGNIIDKYK
jgi:C_GCAxxG_C_C family probable redox protein